MKVLNLRCEHGHGFEGWFASQDDYARQRGRNLVACPLCGNVQIDQMPSAPRLNLSAPAHGVAVAGGGAEGPPSLAPDSMSPDAPFQGRVLLALRDMLRRTEDVGERFAEEARRIHYGEARQRGIRGQATAEQHAELLDEGIEVVALALPAALKSTAH